MSKKILVLGLTAILTLSILYAVLQLSNSPNPNPSSFGHLALNSVLVDSLSPQLANPRFDKMVINILEETGFAVDHYSGSNAIANFSEKLPEKSYGIIILRTHLRQGVPTSPSLKFQNTIIIAMGCNGFDLYLAETLAQRGVGAYIAWKGYVRLSRTDQAVIYLLEHLLIKKQTLEQAVTETMEKLGPDTTSNTTLHYYPLEAGNHTIWDIANSSNTNFTEGG